MSGTNPDPEDDKITGLEPGGGVPPGETPPGEGSVAGTQEPRQPTCGGHLSAEVPERGRVHPPQRCDSARSEHEDQADDDVLAGAALTEPDGRRAQCGGSAHPTAPFVVMCHLSR